MLEPSYTAKAIVHIVGYLLLGLLIPIALLAVSIPIVMLWVWLLSLVGIAG